MYPEIEFINVAELNFSKATPSLSARSISTKKSFGIIVVVLILVVAAIYVLWENSRIVKAENE